MKRNIMNQERRYLTDKDKEEIGLQCCNCQSTEDLEYHHVVPIIFGGNDINSNIFCVCHNCHSKIHFSKNGKINHSEAIKAGIQKAKENGVHCGRKKTSYEDIPYELREDLKNKNYDTITALANKHGISRRSIYKYKNIIEENKNV